MADQYFAHARGSYRNRRRSQSVRLTKALSNSQQYKEDEHKAEEYFEWSVPIGSSSTTLATDVMEIDSSQQQQERLMFYVTQDIFGQIMAFIPAYPYYFMLRRVLSTQYTILVAFFFSFFLLCR